MTDKQKKNEGQRVTDKRDIDIIKGHIENKIAELEVIKNQYIGAIEAYKEVLNNIVDKEQSGEENKVTEI